MKNIIIDSNMSFDEAVKGSVAPSEVLSEMALLSVKYYSTDSNLHQGQIMVNKAIAKDVEEIFAKILEEKFVVNKCVPMSFYNWDDDLSMEDNNSSAFCYRVIAGTDRLSKHSFGTAVDINPQFNPLIKKDGGVIPSSGKYDTNRAGTLVEGSDIVKSFLDRGFVWGKFFQAYADIHHFEKSLNI